MKFRSFVLVGVAVVGCGTSTSTGANREIDDHPGGGSGGSVGAGGATGGIVDARAPEAGAELCGGGGAVTNVRMSRAPTKPAPAGTGGALARVDGGYRLPGLPTDPCASYAAPDCPGGPRPIFGCPIVYGPNRNPMLHPGDMMTVTLEESDDGNFAYSCAGVGTDSPLTGGASLYYAVRPAYVQETGQIPPSTAPGTVMHFTALASGTRGGPGAAACSNDLTQVDFDVTVE